MFLWGRNWLVRPHLSTQVSIDQVKPRHVHLIQEKFSHIPLGAITFWKSWCNQAGEKIKTDHVISLNIPAVSGLFYATILQFVRVEGLSYFMLNLWTERVDNPLLEAVRLSKESIHILPTHYYHRLEQAWYHVDGSLFINKYIHFWLVGLQA